MHYDSPSNYVMARFYRTAVAVSALIVFASAAQAADPPVPRGNVSTTVNPTTGYHVVNNTTLRLPNGVSVAPTTSGGLPVVSKYPAGLQQTIPSGITIDAIKKTAPLSLTVRATTQSVKGAATRCLTSAKCNVALLLAGAGLDQLFDSLDWIMGEGGKIQKKTDIVSGESSDEDILLYRQFGRDPPLGKAKFSDPASACEAVASAYGQTLTSVQPHTNSYMCRTKKPNGSSDQWALTVYNTYLPCKNPSCSPASSLQPVNSDDIASGVANNYVPDPSDWRALTPELKPDDIEITWAPTLQGEPVTTTEYDADGLPHKIRETNIWYDFDIRDNPSPQPKLDVKKREETKTYEEGVLTGTTTTESTDSAVSDDTPPPPPESPIDCDLFPTACAWFDWTQEEPVEPDDDLSPLLQEVPIVSETYTITGGVAACPAPLVLDLSVFGSREVSYQPLCDLASTMKFLYLALMSFAAAVLLHRSINRV